MSGTVRQPDTAAPEAAAPASVAPAPAAPARAPRIHLPEQLPARFLGVALAVASCDVAEAVHHNVGVKVLVAAAAVAAWWAAPMIDARPVRHSLRWFHVAARRRSTVLAVGSVAAAALTDPPTWLAACVTGLLVAYLLITDEWTRGCAAPRAARAATGPPLTAAAAAAIVFLGATVPVASTSWARLPAALALAATATCLALALRGRATPR